METTKLEDNERFACRHSILGERSFPVLRITPSQSAPQPSS